MNKTEYDQIWESFGLYWKVHCFYVGPLRCQPCADRGVDTPMAYEYWGSSYEPGKPSVPMCDECCRVACLDDSAPLGDWLVKFTDQRPDEIHKGCRYRLEHGTHCFYQNRNIKQPAYLDCKIGDMWVESVERIGGK